MNIVLPLVPDDSSRTRRGSFGGALILLDFRGDDEILPGRPFVLVVLTVSDEMDLGFVSFCGCSPSLGKRRSATDSHVSLFLFTACAACTSAS